MTLVGSIAYRYNYKAIWINKVFLEKILLDNLESYTHEKSKQ